MTPTRPARCAALIATALLLHVAAADARQPPRRAKPPQRAATVPRAAPAAAALPAAAAPAEETAVPEATTEQVLAAGLVFLGRYDCEFGQTISVLPSAQHAAYVELVSTKAVALMRPVLSPTGAIRLEDVRGATLVVQINAKSMLFDVHAGRRLIDDCVGTDQRALLELARELQVASQRAAAAAGTAASAPDAAEGAPAPAPAEAATATPPPADAAAAVGLPGPAPLDARTPAPG